VYVCVCGALQQYCMAMMHSRPPTGSSYDNDERHVILFRPISEAARCWSYDNNRLINIIPSFNHILDALLPTLTREASGTFLTNSGQQSVVFCATCSLQAVLQHARVPRFAVHTGRKSCLSTGFITHMLSQCSNIHSSQTLQRSTLCHHLLTTHP